MTFIDLHMNVFRYEFEIVPTFSFSFGFLVAW